MATDRDKLGLPPREFFYHFDQIAAMIQVSEKQLRLSYIYYMGVTAGPPRRDKIHAVNIAPEGEAEQWRVTESAFKRWMKFKGLRFHSRGFV